MICCGPAWPEAICRLFRKPCRVCLQRQIEPVGEIRYGAIETAEQDNLQHLVVVVMGRQRLELGIIKGGAVMQRIDGRNHRPLRLRPAWRVDLTKHGGADLIVGETGWSAKAVTCTPHSYSHLFSAQVRSMTISRSLSDSGPRSSRLPARNLPQAR